jgi:twitching motility protein PilT
VLSTLHTIDVAETVGRMVEFFPEAKQQLIRSVMAGVLKGVISQRLIPRIDGGRVAAVEVMVMNNRISDLVRENETESIPEAIEDGDFFDMQTFTQALIEHVVEGRVDREVAANASTNRHDFLVTLDQAMKRRAHAEQVASQEAEQAQREAEGTGLPELRLA